MEWVEAEDLVAVEEWAALQQVQVATVYVQNVDIKNPTTSQFLVIKKNVPSAKQQ